MSLLARLTESEYEGEGNTMMELLANTLAFYSQVCSKNFIFINFILTA